jgi:hypothetical protein
MGWASRVLFAAALLCCSSLAAAAAVPPRETISPPAGWAKESLIGSRSAALGYVIAQWLSYNRGGEEYVEVTRRTGMGLSRDDFVEYFRTEITRSGFRVLAFRNIRLCNGETGWYMRAHSTVYPHEPMIDSVFFVDGAYAYFAAYHYPDTLQPVPRAERAIASLCVSNPVTARKIVLPVAFSPPPGYLMSDPHNMQAILWPGAVAFYLNPSHPNDLLLIARDPLPGETPTADEAAQERAAEKTLKRSNARAKMLSAATPSIETLCDDNTGIAFSYTVRVGENKLAYQHMMLLGTSEMYSAVYIRPESTLPFKPASDALRTLCPLDAASPTPSPTPQSPTPQVTQSPR